MQNGKLMMTFDCLKTNLNLKNAIASANALSKQFRWVPQGLTVLGPSEVNWPSDFTSDWEAEFKKLGQATLTGFLKRNKASSGISSKVLLQPYQSTKETVRLVAKEARSKKASAIAVFTHGRKAGPGVPGGFVASMIYESSVPVLALNATAPRTTSVKTILLATDFSREGARTFRKTVALAKKTRAKLVLLHILPTNFNETMAASVELAGGWNNVETYLKAEESAARTKANRWMRQATAQGVNGSIEILNNSYSVPKSVLTSAARNRADLIVVTQKIGRWSSYVLGSVTRDILAKSLLPVLVMPTQTLRRKSKASK